MKKVLFTVLLCLLFVGVANAAPRYLVCDPALPQDEVTNYKLFFDGGAAIDHTPVGGAIHYDLTSIEQGAHTVVGQACNDWGCSDSSLPFVFTKKLPTAPGILRISP